MTIEIKQLVIRAVADPGRDRSNPLVAQTPRVEYGMPTATHPATYPPVHPQAQAEQREAIVASCVREVLRKLERSRER